MLSIILYGRNDNHGYNLQKRAAISLNCLAEILQEDEDEIIFVDWNTPINLPTFPEAISDTLTDKAKKYLKIIRVRPEIHEKLAKNITRKPTIEPVARNTALIRSNPKNRWVLSTNTDVILLLNKNFNLISYLDNLSSGLYEAPRYSIPDGIWETFDRNNPKEIFSKLDFYAQKIDLDEIVATGNIQQFDAPGDFQLLPRIDLINLYGFDEDMKKGWGVDSNLCKRMFLHYGETKIISENIKVYHCEHTRFLTHFTESDEHNDSNKYFYHVNTPTLVNQRNFGLSEIDLPLLKLSSHESKKISTLIKNSPPPIIPRQPIYTQMSGNLVSYPATHALPYILDIFEGAEAKDFILYFGDHSKMKHKIVNSLKEWKNLNVQFIQNPIEIVDLNFVVNQISNENFSYFIFDYGAELDPLVDISNYTHSDDKYRNFISRNKFHNVALDLIENVIKFKKDISKIFFIFLNAETYGHGAGNRIRDFIPLQQVAINSRVRFGQIKPNLLDIDFNLLKKTIEFNKFELLKYNVLKESEPLYRLNSHQFFQIFYESLENFSFIEVGTFISKQSKISLNNIFKYGKQIVFEFDYPNLAGTILNKFDVEVFNKSRSFLKSLKFNGYEGETNFLLINESDFPEQNKFLFFKINESSKNVDFDGDRIYQVRLTNISFNNGKKRRNWFILKNVPETNLLKNGWSYSNETLGRWVLRDQFQIQNPKFSQNKRIFIILNSSDYLNSNLKIKLNSVVNQTYLSKIKIPKIHPIIYFAKVENEEYFKFDIKLSKEDVNQIDFSIDQRQRLIQFSDLIVSRNFMTFYLVILLFKNIFYFVYIKFKITRKLNVFFFIALNIFLKKVLKKMNSFKIQLKMMDYKNFIKYKSYLD